MQLRIQGGILSAISLALAWSFSAAAAPYQVQPAQPQANEPENGAAFQCQDGSRLILSFAPGDGLSALIQVQGKSYRLPYRPPEPGPTQIVWSDGDHSLTWSPGVQLMWMGDGAHLMCGRGGHHH